MVLEREDGTAVLRAVRLHRRTHRALAGGFPQRDRGVEPAAVDEIRVRILVVRAAPLVALQEGRRHRDPREGVEVHLLELPRVRARHLRAPDEEAQPPREIAQARLIDRELLTVPRELAGDGVHVRVHLHPEEGRDARAQAQVELARTIGVREPGGDVGARGGAAGGAHGALGDRDIVLPLGQGLPHLRAGEDASRRRGAGRQAALQLLGGSPIDEVNVDRARCGLARQGREVVGQPIEILERLAEQRAGEAVAGERVEVSFGLVGLACLQPGAEGLGVELDREARDLLQARVEPGRGLLAAAGAAEPAGFTQRTPLNQLGALPALLDDGQALVEAAEGAEDLTPEVLAFGGERERLREVAGPREGEGSPGLHDGGEAIVGRDGGPGARGAGEVTAAKDDGAELSEEGRGHPLGDGDDGEIPRGVVEDPLLDAHVLDRELLGWKREDERGRTLRLRRSRGALRLGRDLLRRGLFRGGLLRGGLRLGRDLLRRGLLRGGLPYRGLHALHRHAGLRVDRSAGTKGSLSR